MKTRLMLRGVCHLAMFWQQRSAVGQHRNCNGRNCNGRWLFAHVCVQMSLGNESGEGRHRANNDGVDQRADHRHDSFAHWFVSFCRRMCDCCGTLTGFMGKNCTSKVPTCW